MAMQTKIRRKKPRENPSLPLVAGEQNQQGVDTITACPYGAQPEIRASGVETPYVPCRKGKPLETDAAFLAAKGVEGQNTQEPLDPPAVRPSQRRAHTLWALQGW